MDKPELVAHHYQGGIRDFVRHLNATKEALFEMSAGSRSWLRPKRLRLLSPGILATSRTEFTPLPNGISTLEGGMHEQGFRSALTRTVNTYARNRDLLKKKDENLQGEDIREGLTAIISVRLQEPQFEGQTKSKLGNVSIRSLVEKATNDHLGQWFEENPREARAMVGKAMMAGQSSHCRHVSPPNHSPQVRP